MGFIYEDGLLFKGSFDLQRKSRWAAFRFVLSELAFRFSLFSIAFFRQKKLLCAFESCSSFCVWFILASSLTCSSEFCSRTLLYSSTLSRCSLCFSGDSLPRLTEANNLNPTWPPFCWSFPTVALLFWSFFEELLLYNNLKNCLVCACYFKVICMSNLLLSFC